MSFHDWLEYTFFKLESELYIEEFTCIQTTRSLKQINFSTTPTPNKHHKLHQLENLLHRRRLARHKLMDNIHCTFCDYVHVHSFGISEGRPPENRCAYFQAKARIKVIEIAY